AYPDLQTLTYTQSRPELVEAAKQAIENLGWELVNTDVDEGIVEATETTAWFGFKDDVIIRVTDNDSERLVGNVPGLQIYVVKQAEKYTPNAVDVASGLNIAAFNIGIAL
ncbi:DUF1499 domain-containing protein, partial [Pseudoalteromonas sp. SIMBA_153]